jgi:hypothetical protein
VSGESSIAGFSSRLACRHVRVLAMTQRLRIFISSPGDVQEERLRASLVVQKLARDYARFFRIEAYLWEHEPMLASGHFQDAIEVPSASDIMVLIVYSRLGTPLPERSALREYRGLDGRSPVTGTEWEFEEALSANRARGAPDLLAYRKLGDPGTSLADPGKRDEQQRQWDALQNFWHRHFETGTLFLAGSAKFNTLEEFDQKFEADLVALIQRRIEQGMLAATEENAAHWLKGSPFRGLASYDFADSPIFFGRDSQTCAATTRLQVAAEAGCAFLLLLGASGSGKSSVARAGILPALFAPKAITGVAIWRRVVLRPGEGDPDPVMGLARALCDGQPASGIGLPELVTSPDQVASFAVHLEASADNPSYPIQQALDRVIASERINRALLPHETARLVILIDQMEELFTRDIAPARRALFVRILSGLARSGRVWVVSTMRNDLWHRAVEIPQLIELVEAGSRMDLVPPDGSEIIEIIRRPAAAAGLRFETDAETGVSLDATLARDAAEEPGALPLLSVMLDALFARDVAPNAGGAAQQQLRFSTYRDLGELTGAIARRADEIFNAVAATDPEAAASFPNVLRALVTASSRGADVTSRSASLDQFVAGGPETRLMTAFAANDARLLVTSMSPHGVEVRVAHEALIEKWPRARDQIALDRRDLETRSRLESLLRRWTDAATDSERSRALLQGLNLAEGSDLVHRWKIGADAPLGRFVQASERAHRWRQRRLLIAASLLIGLFGGLAALATLQWSRADVATQAALRSEAIEREARATAERERNRATENEKQTADALRQNRRETARTLAAQVNLSVGQHDVRGALALAVQAATIEKEALLPDERPASEPALLKALAGAREVLHVAHATQGWAMPYAFVDDSTLAYADAQSGIVTVDLHGKPAVTKLVALESAPEVRFMVSVAQRGLIVAALQNELRIVDMRTDRTLAVIPFKERINAIDVDADGRRVAVATGFDVGIVDLDAPTNPAMLRVPVENAVVGQVRFARQGNALLATAGIRIFGYDFANAAYADLNVQLSGTGMGVDQATLQSVLAGGWVPFVRIEPDPSEAARLFTYAPLELQALDLSAPVAETLRTNNPEFEFSGMSALDQERRGRASTLAVVQSRSRNDRLEFQLRYVGGSSGVLRGSDGRLLPPFAGLSVMPDDFAKRKPHSCLISPAATFLACQYSDKEAQGIVAWRLLGGDHVFARTIERSGATSGLQLRGSELLVSDETGLVRIDNGQETRMLDLPEGWRLVAAEGDSLVALSRATGFGRIFRLSEDRIVEVIPPMPAIAISLAGNGDRALVINADRVSLLNTATGTPLWSAPIGDVQYSRLTADGAVLVSGSAAYAVDAGTGRILSSHPLKLANGAAVALDSRGQKLAYLDADNRLQLLDLKTGATQGLDTPSVPTRLIWPGDGPLLVGGTDGSVVAIRPGAGSMWSIPSPFSRSFKASAWPGQPAQGVVLDLAMSSDGTRLAVVRQDMPNIDLHDSSTGGWLTALTPPSSTLGIPASVSFGPGGDIVTAWAFHAMTRDRPKYVAVHRLPRNFDEALAAAGARLGALKTIWSPSGPMP